MNCNYQALLGALNTHMYSLEEVFKHCREYYDKDQHMRLFKGIRAIESHNLKHRGSRYGY